MEIQHAHEVGQYKEVRGLVRGLDLLRALNSTPGGGASTSALAKTCNVHRTTAKRLLETLRSEGMVRLGARDGFYLLSDRVLQLSSALRGVSWVSEVALPLMQEAASELKWPCDIATFSEGRMVVRESTYRWSPVAAHRPVVGECLPVMKTAIGRAYLAACSDGDLDETLDAISRCEVTCGALTRDDMAVRQQLIQETRARGYAVNDKTSSRRWPDYAVIGVAVRGPTRPLAAMNLMYQNATMTTARLENHFVPKLLALAKRIEQGYSQWCDVALRHA